MDGYKRTIDWFLMALAMLSVSMASPAVHSSSCEAEVKVGDISVRGPRFSFVSKDGGTPIQVFAIRVYDADGVVCSVSGRKPDGTIALHTGDWTYGDVPPGFKVDATCRSLERGKRYRIYVTGQCLGSTSFLFEPHDGDKKP